MKKTLLAGGLAALMLAAAAGAAFAQQPPARGMRADADGDRRLSQAEFVGQRVQRLTTADTNRDGSVTADERRAAMQASRAGRADARFDRLDANDDGSVSRAEFDAARSAAREVRAERGPRPMGAHRGPARGQRGMGRMEARGPVVITEVQARAGSGIAGSGRGGAGRCGPDPTAGSSEGGDCPLSLSGADQYRGCGPDGGQRGSAGKPAVTRATGIETGPGRYPAGC